MKNDAEQHIHTPDSWARAVGSLALDQARAGGGGKPGGPPVRVDVEMTVQVVPDCHRFCVIIGGTKMCFCL